MVVQLKEKKLKGGADDSATVVRYSEAIFKPMQGQSVGLGGHQPDIYTEP